jgi:DNA-binding NarL/FixJ family response regulator
LTPDAPDSPRRPGALTRPIRVLIVDDHPVVRDGLRGMLSGQQGIEVVAEAADGAEALAAVRASVPGVVLMDLRMPNIDGVAAIRRIGAAYPGTRILVLTTYDTDTDIARAIEAGATGYLLKDTPREELARAVRAAARGEPVLAPAVAARLMDQMRGPAQESLSGREIEVLDLVRDGLSNREVAARLFISEATVKTHLIHVFSKLGVADRTAAVTVALERGILSIDR